MLLVAPLVFRAPEGPAAVCAGGRRPARWPSAPRASLGASSFLRVLLVAPRVFRAPEGPAAREARRPHFVRHRASKPGQAPPPPTGTAARPPLPRLGPTQNSFPLGEFYCADGSHRRPTTPVDRLA